MDEQSTVEDAFGVELTLLCSPLRVLMDIKLWLFSTRNTLPGSQSYTEEALTGGLWGDMVPLRQR